MFHELIKYKMNEWYTSDDCKIRNIIDYIVKTDKLRDAQIESIKTYLFFKIYCKNLPLNRLFKEGYFIKNIVLEDMPISSNLTTFLKNNKTARQLYEISLENDSYKMLKEEIEKNYEKLNYEKIFDDFFRGITYSDYIYSLPMGAGKTYLMAAFIYINLYFAINESQNKVFAHNFIVLAPSGLKSSIIPSLKTIKDFDVTWIFPEPIATNLKKQIKYEILDEVKTANKSNKIKNPNVAKIAQYQPYKEMFGVVFLTNAEKVILDKVKIVNDQLQLDFENSDVIGKVANELRETINKIPNMSIFIDEVHHATDEEIKLRKVVEYWSKSNTINEVIGFSGTPFLDTPEIFKINNNLSIKNSDISNTIYYYPLTNGIDNFLKRPTIIASTDNNSSNIIREGLKAFFDRYLNVFYDNVVSKIAIYCGNIKNLEESVYPIVSKYVASIGLNPNDVILKYHGGNKEYSLPKENELKFASLDTSISKVRVILLVGIGKEGWDCKSLTGVILSQKGDCPTKMVLQTSCRCLRQVCKGKLETAIIYLNRDNESLLSSQLKKQQNSTIEQLQKGTRTDDQIQRHNRMEYLKLPDIEYYKMEVSYSTSNERRQLSTKNELLKILDFPEIKENVLIKELDLNGNEKIRNVNKEVYGEDINYKEWLLEIVKESFNNLSLDQLKCYDKELYKIYKNITINEIKLNEIYNHRLIKSLIRQAFYEKRILNMKKEEVSDASSILNIKEIPKIICNDKEALFPNLSEVVKILNSDKNKKIPDLASLSPEEFKKVVLEHPEYLSEIEVEKTIAENNKDKTLHYIPYVFNQSKLEKTFLEKLLSMNIFQYKNLEVYYNGDHNIANFRIKCYKTEDKKIKTVGLYTPDFLVLKRNEKNKINKVLIVETKGKVYSGQQEFVDRRNYVEKEFIKFNNKKYGYQKFDYLYIEDTKSENEIISSLNDKIQAFFKEVN